MDIIAKRLAGARMPDHEIVKLLSENIFSTFSDKKSSILKNDRFFRKSEFRHLGVGYRFSYKGRPNIIEFRIIFEGTNYVAGMLVCMDTFRKDPMEYAAHVAMQLTTCRSTYDKVMKESKNGPIEIASKGKIIQ